MEVRQHKHNTHALSSTRGSPSRSVGRPKSPTHAPHTPHTSHRERADTEILLHLYSTLLFLILGTPTEQPLSRLFETTSFSFERCEHERHVYELCQYKDYKKRVKAAEDAK